MDEPWGPMLVSNALGKVARHGFTTRQLALRPGEGAGRSWSAVAASIGCAASRVGRVRQVHGATVRVVTGQTLEGPVPDADAIVTRESGVAVAVVAADCVPVLLADPATGAVGAVHAGWRGTAANVVGAAVRVMARECGTDPATLVAAIGPSIGPCCYTVGSELVTAFRQAGHQDDVDRWFSSRDGVLVLDLWAANRDLLAVAGIPTERIHSAGLCTKSNAAVFESFRADGERAGRMAAVIVAP
jgi:polyphenol oxidase